jgi:tRNA dimethylallyltransferase
MTAGEARTRATAIVGPTAAGKSEVAVEVAERLDGEIISVDSMQVYSGMNIGTDKVPAEVRRRVPHHLLDHWDPSHDLTVSEFQRSARDAIEDISRRSRLPVLVGGSGLYFRAVVDDLNFPPRSIQVRTRFEEEVEREGAERLHARLRSLDPGAAVKIEPTNARRIIRALEVIGITGRPFSENNSWDRYESRYDLTVAGLSRSRPELYARIEKRVHDMLRRGLVEEARALEAAGMSRTARQALGYRQVLENGEGDSGALAEAIAKATKRFARRQESWFRADPRVRWFEASKAHVAEQVSEFFAAYGALA